MQEVPRVDAPGQSTQRCFRRYRQVLWQRPHPPLDVHFGYKESPWQGFRGVRFLRGFWLSRLRSIG